MGIHPALILEAMDKDSGGGGGDRVRGVGGGGSSSTWLIPRLKILIPILLELLTRIHSQIIRPSHVTHDCIVSHTVFLYYKAVTSTPDCCRKTNIPF